MQTKQNTPSAEPVEQAIEFRVTRDGLPKRRLRLVGTRYTLGSGTDCSVRLEDSSLLPIHAWITRQQRQVTLRAVGRPIYVNGRARTQCQLQPGDRFQLGVYDFELVAPASVSEQRLQLQSQLAELASDESSPQKAPSRIAAPVNSPSPTSEINREKVIPRRRLSFAETLGWQDAQQPPKDSRPAPEEPTPAIQLPVVTFDLNSALQLPTAEVPLQNAELVQKARQKASEIVEQHQALLANERRWQERLEKQQERYRQREQRSQSQIESLRAAQQAADRRAHQAEEAVHSLRTQLAELNSRVSTFSSTMMPNLQQQIEQQQLEVAVASRQHQQLVDSLRGRLDLLQGALDEMQVETRNLRQQASVSQELNQELSSETESLESSLQELLQNQQAQQQANEAVIERLREDLRQTTLKLSQVTGELEDARQLGQGLGALVQQLRSSLSNLQTEAQRNATLEQIEELQSQLQGTDQRITLLVAEYDAQSSQMQQECEELRQRLELNEQLSQQASTTATDALHRALDSIDAISTLSVPNNIAATPQAAPRSFVDEYSEEQPLPFAAVPNNADTNGEFTNDEYANNEYADNEVISEDLISEAVGSEEPVLQEPGGDDLSLSRFYQREEADDWSANNQGTSVGSDQGSGEDYLDLDRLRDQITTPSEPVEDVSISSFHLPLEGNDYNGYRASETPASNSISSSSAPSSLSNLDDDTDYEYQETTPISMMGDEPAADDEYVDGMTYQIDLQERFSIQGSDHSPVMNQFATPEEDLEEPTVPEESLDSAGPRSTAEILASLGITLEDEEEVPPQDSGLEVSFTSDSASQSAIEEAPAAAPEPVAADQPKIHSHDNAQSNQLDQPSENEEESIEAYMNRLLQRVQGGSSADSVPATKSDPPSRPATTTLPTSSSVQESESAASISSSNLAAMASVAAAASPATAAQPDEPYSPKRAAPERSSDLAAMRELANDTARHAIATSARRRLANEAMFKFVIFCFGTLAGLTTLVGSGFSMDQWLVIAVCCFLMAGFFLMEALALRTRLRNMVDEPSNHVEPAELTGDPTPEAQP